MRTSGLLIIGGMVWLAACKSASVPSASTAPYQEDLAPLRPALTEITRTSEPGDPVIAKAIDPTISLKSELDSVSRIIVAMNLDQKYVDGYTIQIYSGSEREAAMQARDLALLVNPELKPEVSYHQPSYKVKAGQYTDRLEAHRIFSELKKEFPQAILIPERIVVQYD